MQSPNEQSNSDNEE
jgi:alpha-D-ribose 1-methylphosphonate 5-triphosphate diphosphatase PhnM